jgi:hypothetical protein
MSTKPQYIKIKGENKGMRKINPTNNYNELLGIIIDYLENNDPNKIYQIHDNKLNKVINNDEDYQTFLKEHSSESNATLSISLVDKNSINIKKVPDYQVESSNILFESCIKQKKNEIEIEKEKEEEEDEDLNEEEDKELTEEEKIKKSLRLMVRSKLKNLEKNIISELCNDIKNSQLISPNQISNSNIVHKGIKCNQCGKKDIIGIRYKCSTCPNYNLCEDCEEDSTHDEDHIFVKIREPVPAEKQLEEKITQSKLKLKSRDFTVEPKVIKIKESDYISLVNVTLTNNGDFTWKKGSVFKCIKEKSNLLVGDLDIKEDIKPGNSVTLELVLEKEDNDFSQKELYISFKLIDDKLNQIGNIHKFVVELI